MKIVKFGGGVIVLEDGTELPIPIPFDEFSITLEELNELYGKSIEVVESLRTVGCDRKDNKSLGCRGKDKDSKNGR